MAQIRFLRQTAFERRHNQLKSEPKFSEVVTLVYSDEGAKKLSKYRGNCNISVEQAAKILHVNLKGNVDTEKIAYVILYLAMKLDDPDQRFKSSPAFRDPKGDTDFPSLSDCIFEGKISRELIMGKKRIVSMFDDNPPTEITDQDEPDDGEMMVAGAMDSEYVRSAKFCAAFLLRGLVKQTDSIINAWANLGNRYKNFYGKKMDGGFVEPCSKEILDNIKERLNADPILSTTWIAVFNPVEYTANQRTNLYKIVRYLCVIPLAYAGMHAFKLFCNFRSQKKVPAYWLMNELSFPSTSDAIDDIYLIFDSFFPTLEDTSKRTQMFKYARLMDSAYFANLQSSACIPLIYVLAKLLTDHCVLPEGADPMNIYGVKEVKGDHKKYLDEVADQIMIRVPEVLDEMYSESAAAALKASKKAGKAAQPRSFFGNK